MTQWNRRWRTTKASKINKFWNNIKNPHERYCTFRIKKFKSKTVLVPVCYDLLPVALQTWLGKGHFLENLAQTLPEKKKEAEKES